MQIESPHILFLAVSFIVAAGIVEAVSEMKPPEIAHAEGQWVGGSSGSDMEFLLLELDEAGEGILVFSELPGGPIHSYRAAARLDEFQISFDLESIDSQSVPIQLSGEFTYIKMDLILSGENWSREVTLRSKGNLKRRLEEVEHRAKELKEYGGKGA